MALDDGKVMIIGGAYGGFNSDVIIYHGSSSTFTVAPDMLFENYGTACSLFYSKKHNSRPVVFVVYGKNAQLFDYTVMDSWEESKNFECPITDLNKRFLPKPMTTTGWKVCTIIC